jgi:SH3-like domain-containing protein
MEKQMDKTAKFAALIVGGFFVLLIAFFALSFTVPSFRSGPASHPVDMDLPSAYQNPVDRTKESGISSVDPDKQESKSSSKNVQEVRICSEKIQDIRTGPGSGHPVSGSKTLSKGQEVEILEERDGWVRVQTISADRKLNGWIRKNQTAPRKKEGFAKFEGNIAPWMKSGLLLNVNPESNTASVNPSQWVLLDDEAKLLFAEALATYCALQSGTGEAWCQITDGNSGRSIATYRTHEGLRDIK